ncbi:hypothetical protein H5410_015095 [Solanum commersonii]|uniref:Uncharacterized protein n=1 Tax=Solanum commersonii TaxID=4109 RepID=A0A9J5ZTF2_SOLCO|nr:hypothetical protein H5410_015095 [Solanum commersonii]
MGNQKLVATNIASTSDLNTDHPMYKEFLDFMQSKQGKDNVPPSYSTVLADEESTYVFDQNYKKEVTFPLEINDLRWKNDPWQLVSRYLDSVSYTTVAYKYRMHYGMILSATRSGEFQHFYPANTRKVYNFSKIIIKRVLTSEEWGMSPLTEKDYIHLEQKIVVKYNYWDYTLYGPSVKNLPEPYKKFYSEWVDISPKLISLEQDNIFFEGMSLMYLFIEFSIPWIMKWSVEVNNTSEGFPCIHRTFHTKLRNKLIQKDPEGKILGQEILDLINITIDKYHNIDRSKP